MPTTKKNIQFNRARFDQGAGFYATKGIAPQTAQLRVAVPFVANNGIYKFDIKKDASLAIAIEQLLKRNDLFIARAIGLGLMVESTTAKGTAPLYSYPVLAGAGLPTGLKGFTDTSAYAVYNGYLTMKTGQSVNYSRFPTAPFLNVPEQQPQIIWNGTVGISSGIVPQFNAENVLCELPEVLVFAGTKDQPITLEFPSCSIAGEAGTQAYAVLIVEGWLYEGGTTEDCHSASNPYNDNF